MRSISEARMIPIPRIAWSGRRFASLFRHARPSRSSCRAPAPESAISIDVIIAGRYLSAGNLSSIHRTRQGLRFDVGNEGYIDEIHLRRRERSRFDPRAQRGLLRHLRARIGRSRRKPRRARDRLRRHGRAPVRSGGEQEIGRGDGARLLRRNGRRGGRTGSRRRAARIARLARPPRR